jgi:prolyl-tRNA synthetase
VGVPLRVTLGKRTVTDGTVDVRHRRDGTEETLPVPQAAVRIAAISKELRPR